MILQITRSGNVTREYVEQAEFVVRCHFSRCRAEFLTIDPDRLYCSRQHSKNEAYHRVKAAPPYGKDRFQA